MSFHAILVKRNTTCFSCRFPCWIKMLIYIFIFNFITLGEAFHDLLFSNNSIQHFLLQLLFNPSDDPEKAAIDFGTEIPRFVTCICQMFLSMSSIHEILGVILMKSLHIISAFILRHRATPPGLLTLDQCWKSTVAQPIRTLETHSFR